MLQVKRGFPVAGDHEFLTIHQEMRDAELAILHVAHANLGIEGRMV